MASLHFWSVDGLDMGAQLSKVVKVNQLPHSHPLACEARPGLLGVMHSKDKSFTWMLLHIISSILLPTYLRPIVKKQILGEKSWTPSRLSFDTNCLLFCHIISLRPRCERSTEYTRSWPAVCMYGFPLWLIYSHIFFQCCTRLCALCAFASGSSVCQRWSISTALLVKCLDRDKWEGEYVQSRLS